MALNFLSNKIENIQVYLILMILSTIIKNQSRVEGYISTKFYTNTGLVSHYLNFMIATFCF